MDSIKGYQTEGRRLQIEAEKLRKQGDDLRAAGYKIADAVVHHLKAICLTENIPCESENDYFTAAAEIARRYRRQILNKQFGLAWLLFLNSEESEVEETKTRLSGDQIKTYFKDAQIFIHSCRDRLK